MPPTPVSGTLVFNIFFDFNPRPPMCGDFAAKVGPKTSKERAKTPRRGPKKSQDTPMAPMLVDFGSHFGSIFGLFLALFWLSGKSIKIVENRSDFHIDFIPVFKGCFEQSLLIFVSMRLSRTFKNMQKHSSF